MLDSPRWAISSVAERFLHTEEATGSIPVSPTIPLIFHDNPFLVSLKTALAQTRRFLDRSGNLGYTFLSQHGPLIGTRPGREVQA